MTMAIRQLEPGEWRTYRAVRLAALRDAPEAFGGTYEHAAAYPEQVWRDWCTQPSWFALEDGEPIGMVRVAQHDDRDLPELISMWVAPGARGTGVAAKLVAALLDWARVSGKRGVYLRVIDVNRRAGALYERLGFVDNGVRDTLPDGRVEIEMEHVFT